MNKIIRTESIQINPKIDCQLPIPPEIYTVNTENSLNIYNQKEYSESKKPNITANSILKKNDTVSHDAKSKWKQISNIIYTVTALRKEKVEKIFNDVISSNIN